MKIIKIDNNDIISLENVRRVQSVMEETNHTSYGQRYTVKHYRIRIIYNNDNVERIECGEDKAGKELSEATMEKIFNILEKD
jgi:hypothetical protein